jgi:hypothetical protein
MTTKNSIITEIIDSALFLPIESVNIIDTINFVYTNGVRKQVIPGKTNEISIIILEGLDKGDEVYLIPPEGANEWSIKRLDNNTLEKYREEKKNKEKKKVGKPSGNEIKKKGRKGNRKKPN